MTARLRRPAGLVDRPWRAVLRVPWCIRGAPVLRAASARRRNTASPTGQRATRRSLSSGSCDLADRSGNSLRPRFGAACHARGNFASTARNGWPKVAPKDRGQAVTLADFWAVFCGFRLVFAGLPGAGSRRLSINQRGYRQRPGQKLPRARPRRSRSQILQRLVQARRRRTSGGGECDCV